LKNKYTKYLLSFSLLLAVGVGVAIYYFINSKPHDILYVEEMANNGDTIYCTLEKFAIKHKSGPVEQGILVSSYNTRGMQLLVKETIKFDFSPNTPTFLGCAGGFVWFCRNEKLVLVYMFKKDSVLYEDASTELINASNPGTQLANITYAPTRGAVYAQINTGDKFVIIPYTFKYVSINTELESYKYALLSDTRIEGGGDRLNVDSLGLFFVDSELASSLKRHLKIEVFSCEGRSTQVVLRDSTSKIKNEFISPKFILHQNGIAVIKHDSQFGDSAQALLTAFNIAKCKFIWQQNANTLFNSIDKLDVRGYCSLSGSYFYLTTTEMPPIKVNFETGNIRK